VPSRPPGSPANAAAAPLGQPTTRPIKPVPKFGACPGPKSGVPIPLSPLQWYASPESHPIPLVGSYAAVGMDPTRCLTYRDRYSMYTDEALGITYRTDVDDEIEEAKAKKKQMYDDDPDNLKPTASSSAAPNVITGGQPAFMGKPGSKDPNSRKHAQEAASRSANAAAKAAASISAGGKSNKNYKRPLVGFNATDPLFGPRKPAKMHEGEWERFLRDRVWKANLRSEELGPISFPDWRALMDACFEKRERERGRAGGVDAFDPASQPLADTIAQEMLDDDVPPKFKTNPDTKRTALVMRSYEGYVWVSCGRAQAEAQRNGGRSVR
jgi:hypothetical protein